MTNPYPTIYIYIYIYLVDIDIYTLPYHLPNDLPYHLPYPGLLHTLATNPRTYPTYPTPRSTPRI